MNTREYQQNFEKLVSRSSWRNKFDQAFSDALFNAVKNYSPKAFELAVYELLGQHNCPTVEDIIKTTRKHFSKFGPEITIEHEPCSWCSGNGLVAMKKVGDPYDKTCFDAHCSRCDNGSKQKQIAAGKGESNFTMPSVELAMSHGFKPVNFRLARVYDKVDEPFVDVGCPWPASIEAIMLQIKRKWYETQHDKFKSSLGFAGLNEKEAWALYLAYTARKWSCPTVTPILSKKRDRSVLNTLDKTFRGGANSTMEARL